MITTKQEEREALEKIREIVKGLGEDSYVAAAFSGCFEIAESNIRDDAAESLQGRLDLAWSSLSAANQRTDRALEEAKEERQRRMNAERLVGTLQKELDDLYNWRPYEFPENAKESWYNELLSCSNTKQLTDEQAIELLHREAGFDPEMIHICHSAPKYLLSDLGGVGRVKITEGRYRRTPLYNASDWNYIRFCCAGFQYELRNGELKFCVG